jgi:hypothetical protein
MGFMPDPKQQPVAKPGDPIDLSESVAGEEDPGASLDIPGKREAPPSGHKPPPIPGDAKPRGSR